ncbi:phosphoenolpyruvate mutase [Stappia sp. ES.058]|uniref:phosphoenolpyruvate mutase n=1 Tax=Stappia sp. ES.058 TaxID=1881061 RepID=UPI00087A5479|nr:phosphoenolpyruvate mutase [Stappia sp. ES.058]SDU33903.1 phosphoenolpyruvate mutase [Stappia sp. ES.058]
MHFDGSPDRLPTQASKFTRLRHLLTRPDLAFLMEAHNGLSARIVEEAGFEGIWASGLSMSATLGVRDNNELSWTQVLDMLEYMSDASTLPILVDGDTGYGNFNNFRRFVRKLCERGIAGVCIEDKIFPKTNSFLGENQPLADVDEFCGKIKAGKDTQTDPDFSIVARVEALIAGRGVNEALARAHAYVDAGADAIVIHSKKSTADEILDFCRQWENRVPVVVIPTKYYRTPTERFRDADVAMVIWANHNLRSSIQAMRETCGKLRSQESLLEVEDAVAPLGDVFALAGAQELEQAEKRYLSATDPARAVILAATRGKGLGDLTAERPKCMVSVRGQSLLGRQVEALGRHGVSDVAVVVGYREDAVTTPGIRKVLNPTFESTGEACSLALALTQSEGDTIISYGDILYRPFFLTLLEDAAADIVLLVDPEPDLAAHDGATRDAVACSQPFGDDLDVTGEAVFLTRFVENADDCNGTFIGLMRANAEGVRKIRETLAALERDGVLDTADLGAVLTRLADEGESIGVVYVRGYWGNVNDVMDLAQARDAV